MRSVPRIVTAGIILFVFPLLAFAESSSTSYILWADGSTAGGNRATSTNYILQEAAGDRSGSTSSSTNYKSYNGFEAVYEEPILMLSLTATSIPLAPDPITPAAVSSGSMSTTVTTNADFGYVLTITEAQAFQNGGAYVLTDVADGTVSAGSEEFGVAVSGTDAAFGNDQAVSSTPLTIASRTIWGTGRTLTITYKAAITTSTPAGAYGGLYRIIATANY
jgi:hypothetical protein